jgi:hypothetical protein
MKTFARLCACLFLLAASARGQQTNALTPEEEKRAALRMPDLDRSALEPGQRRPTDVTAGERNPFGLLAVKQPEEEKEVKIEVETEEMKIRRILGNMRVAGLIGQPGGYRVMIGSMKLAEGDLVPRLFANQGEVLRVENITERQILLSFVERKQESDMPPRTIGLNVDLAPRVRSILPGELFTNVVSFDERGAVSSEPLATRSVDAILKRFGAGQSAEAVTQRQRPLLGEGYPPKKNEQPAE